MGRQRIKVEVQTVAGEDGETTARQPPRQLVDHRMGGGLGSRAQLQYGDDLGQRIESQPKPQRMRPVTEPTPQLVVSLFCVDTLGGNDGHQQFFNSPDMVGETCCHGW
jgi:hypothetical protein